MSKDDELITTDEGSENIWLSLSLHSEEEKKEIEGLALKENIPLHVACAKEEIYI